MDLRLFSIEQTPKSLPVWETILSDLGNPPAPRIARALDVGSSTVYRWNQTGAAPRMACLALFWLTRWGRSEVDAQATNDAMTAAALARSLADERNALRGRVAVLTDERDRLSLLVSRFQLLADRGNASTPSPTHSHTDRSDSVGAQPAPAVPWPQILPPWPELPTVDVRLPPAPSAGASHQGSPATQQPAARSARCPTQPHTRPLRPSAQPAIVSSCSSVHASNVAPFCHHSGIVSPLLEIETSPCPDYVWDPVAPAQPPAGAGPWRQSRPAPASDRQPHSAAAAPPPSCLGPAAGLTRRAVPAPAARPPSPAGHLSARSTVEVLDSEGSPAQPADMGASPHPPGALGAPGRGVFDAMALALAPACHRPGVRWAAQPTQPGQTANSTD
jgi:hypothetical protein